MPERDSVIEQVYLEVWLDPSRPAVRVQEFGRSNMVGPVTGRPLDGSEEEALKYVATHMPDQPPLSEEQSRAAREFGNVAAVLASRLGKERQSAYGPRTVYGFNLTSGDRVRASEHLGEQAPDGHFVFIPDSEGVSFEIIEAAKLTERTPLP